MPFIKLNYKIRHFKKWKYTSTLCSQWKIPGSFERLFLSMPNNLWTSSFLYLYLAFTSVTILEVVHLHAERLPASVAIYCMWISALKAYTWVSNNSTSIPSSSKGPKPTCFNLLFSAVTVCTSLIWRRKTVCCDTTCTGVPLWEQAAHVPWTACVSVCVSSGWLAPSPLPNCQLLHYTQWGVRGEY